MDNNYNAEMQELMQKLIDSMEERTGLAVELQEALKAEKIDRDLLDKLTAASDVLGEKLKEERKYVDRLEALTVEPGLGAKAESED